jgi:hypothetical protein
MGTNDAGAYVLLFDEKKMLLACAGTLEERSLSRKRREIV